MKTRCKKFSDSISPKTVPKSNEEIRELLDCLEADVKVYVSSLEMGSEAYLNHFTNSIFPILEKKKLLKSFESQLIKNIRVLEAKTVSIFHNLQVSISNLANDIDQVNTINKYAGTNSMSDKHYFIESLKIVYIDFSNLLMIASQIFFALEFYCKILCALGCVKFALKLARAELIQHNHCWKQLKRFSNKNCSYCETCVVSDTCTSEIAFEALSRIYCYSMKIRQIADYTPKFISFDIFKSGLIEPPLVYFKHLESVLKEYSLFYKCLADVMPEIGTRDAFRKTIAKELMSPFIWGDEKRLKESIEKNENSDFYNYLLGRLYYQKNRFDAAIEPLEKAKKINPKNADVWKLLSTIYDAEAETKEDLAKAIEYCKKASSLDPSNAEIFLELAVLELACGNYSSSFENLTKANEYASKESDKCAIFAVLSEAYRMKHMIHQSEYYLKEANQISRAHTDATIKWLRGFIEERAKLR